MAAHREKMKQSKQKQTVDFLFRFWCVGSGDDGRKSYSHNNSPKWLYGPEWDSERMRWRKRAIQRFSYAKRMKTSSERRFSFMLEGIEMVYQQIVLNRNDQARRASLSLFLALCLLLILSIRCLCGCIRSLDLLHLIVREEVTSISHRFLRLICENTHHTQDTAIRISFTDSKQCSAVCI